MQRLNLLIWSCLAIAQFAQAQSRNANWVFGSGVWLYISQDTVISELMPDTVSQRNACISDTSGQFLLLADDFGIRNALFDTIEGGTPSALGWNVPAGNYLILPLPGHPSQYAVFINELPPSARAGFVLVDMAANGGAGAVVGNGTFWYLEHSTAKISATMDAAGTGYWVLLHTDDDDAFHAFHLSEAGLDPVPATSHAGTAYLPSTSPKNNLDLRGQMTFSVQGHMLGVVKNDISVDTSKIELFNFDRSTGTLEHWADLGVLFFINGEQYPPQPPRLQGLDFDITGQLLFTSHLDTAGPDFSRSLVEYDLNSPPDSLAEHALAMFTGGSSDPQNYDSQFGSFFKVDPYDRLIWTSTGYPSGGYLFQSLIGVELPLVTVGGEGFISYPPETKLMGGFPSPCKRYIDSDPLATGIVEQPRATAVRIRPNPMTDRAALVFNGPAHPESVIWRDTLGRVVRRTAVGQIGPTYTLERNGLPAGLYFVEVRGSNGTLGVVKVLCE